MNGWVSGFSPSESPISDLIAVIIGRKVATASGRKTIDAFAFFATTKVKNSTDLIEIAFQNPTSCGFEVDIHYVMRAQDPGFYFFLAGQPNVWVGAFNFAMNLSYSTVYRIGELACNGPRT